jgi:hypothetical protein
LKKIHPSFVIYAAGFILTALWFLHTDPHVNEEALHHFYQPLLRTLNILVHFGYERLDLLAEAHHGPYPYGIYIFPLFFYSLGLSALVQNFPFLVNLLLLLVYSLAAHIAFPEKKRSAFFYLLFFSFPLFQIDLKGFSPHSWNAGLCFLMLLLFERYEQDKKRFTGLMAVLCGIFCFSLKHYGFFLLFLYFVCRIWVNFCRKELNFSYFGHFLCIFVFGAFFYPNNRFFNYAQTNFEHYANSALSATLFVFLLFVGLLFLTTHLIRRFQNSLVSVRIAGRPGFIICHGVLFFLFFGMILPDVSSRPWLFYLFFLIFALSAVWVFLYSLPENFFWYVIFYAFLGGGYFLYLFAPCHSSFFVLPALIAFLIGVREDLSRTFGALLIFCGLVLSNFFPSISTIKRVFSNRSSDHIKWVLQERLLNSRIWNPLSWRAVPMNKLRREIQQLVLPCVAEDWPVYAVTTNMEILTQAELNWPPYLFLDNVPGFGEAAEAEFRSNGLGQTFLRWHESGLVPLFFEPLPDSFLATRANDLMTFQWLEKYFAGLVPLQNGAGLPGIVGDAWLDFLRQRDLLKEYDSLLLPVEEPVLRVYWQRCKYGDLSLSVKKGIFSPEPIVLRELAASENSIYSLKNQNSEGG